MFNARLRAWHCVFMYFIFLERGSFSSFSFRRTVPSFISPARHSRHYLLSYQPVWRAECMQYVGGFGGAKPLQSFSCMPLWPLGHNAQRTTHGVECVGRGRSSPGVSSLLLLRGCYWFGWLPSSCPGVSETQCVVAGCLWVSRI